MMRDHAVEVMNTIYSLARLLGAEADDVALRDSAYVIRDVACGALVYFKPDSFRYDEIVGLIQDTRQEVSTICRK